MSPIHNKVNDYPYFNFFEGVKRGFREPLVDLDFKDPKENQVWNEYKLNEFLSKELLASLSSFYK